MKRGLRDRDENPFTERDCMEQIELGKRTPVAN